jgi:hypothetical protein
MALVRSLTPADMGNRGRVHDEVECGYTVFEDGGKSYSQLDAYGSPGRAIPGKVSQTVQFDQASARQLKRLLEQTFPGI